MKKKEAEDFALTVSAGEKKKKAINPLDENQSFADIEDYLIHLGYYDRFKKNITISFSKTGNYTFDALRIIAVGMENFASQAVENKASAFRSEKITDNYVKGAVSCKQDGLLYLSMINNPGWKVYVDGERVKNTATVNYAFMGIPVQKGEHVVELRYRPVGFYPGLALFGIGIIGIAALFVWERKKGCK